MSVTRNNRIKKIMFVIISLFCGAGVGNLFYGIDYYVLPKNIQIEFGSIF